MKRIIILLLRIAIIMLLLSGCSHTFRVDLEAQRRLNIIEDMNLLNFNQDIELPDLLTLDQAVTIGMANNLDMRLRRIMAEIADEESLSAKLKLLPRLMLDAEISHRDEYSLSEYENLDTGEKALGRSISTEKTRKAANLTLSWNILDFGLSYIRARQTALEGEIKRMERLRQAQKLALDIASAYWRAVMAELDLRMIEDIKDEVTAYQQRAAEMVLHKRLDPIIAKTFEKRIAELSISTANLQADISGARIELCNLMGVSPLAEFDLDHETPHRWIELAPEAESLNHDALEWISLRRRPEFYAADLQTRIEQDEARGVILSMFPGLRAYFTNSYDANKYLINNHWVTVGANLMVDFLTLPHKYADWRSKEKRIERSKLERILLTAGVIAQTHLALHDYRIKERHYQLQLQSHRITEELMSMTRQRHELGTLSDTIITQQMLETMVSQLAFDRAKIELLKSYGSLLITIGLDYPLWNIPLSEIELQEFPHNINEQDITDYRSHAPAWEHSPKRSSIPITVPTLEHGNDQIFYLQKPFFSYNAYSFYSNIQSMLLI